MVGTVWYPGADTTSQSFDLAPYHRGPVARPGCGMKLLAHTTEGHGHQWPAYGGGASAPHLTGQPDYEAQRILWRQHFPFDRYARALRVDPTMPVVNDAGVVQVELTGTSGWASPENPTAPYVVEPYVPRLPDWYWRSLAELWVWLHLEWAVELTVVPGGFLRWGRSARLPYDEWLPFSGLIGHQHVPGNDHTDPGAIPAARVLEHALAIKAGKPIPITPPPTEETPVMVTIPTNTGRPSVMPAAERAVRGAGYQITCGPSMAGTSCLRGRHGHLWKVEGDRVVDWSTHYVDSAGGIGGTHVGGAVDAGRDPAPGVPVSTYEKAHLDDLARILVAAGYRVIWGVENHFDHLHFDYVKAPNQLVYQGPNAGFTVAEIAAAQTGLAALPRKGGTGVYYTGRIDGLRETNTRAAIRAFQSDHPPLTVDEKPGPATMAALARALEAAKTPVDVNEGFPAAHVEWVQVSLKTLKRPSTGLPYYGGAVDGELGDQTRAGVTDFQGDHGLLPDGRPGPATTDKLKAVLAAPPPPPPPTLAELVAKHRVMGSNGVATGLALDSWKPTVAGPVVLLASADSTDYVAAMGAAVRAGSAVRAWHVPRGGALPPLVRSRLDALKPTVVIVGGPLAIPDTTARDAILAAGKTL